MLKPIHLTPADVAKIEEGMNTEDVEHMVAIVDQIVARRLRSFRKAASLGMRAAQCVK